MAAQFVFGAFLPRGDQEKRAGIGYSWNLGTDYNRQLDRSGRGLICAQALRDWLPTLG